MDPKEEKQRLRDAIKDRLQKLPEKDRIAESRSLSKRILEVLPPSPLHVTGYFPVKDEADIRPALQALLDRGDAVYLPRFEGGKMVFRRVMSFSGLTPGQFGIPEPPMSAPLLQPPDLGAALVPGRAFARTGDRLGRGNGGFDIWIRSQRSANPHTKFWGVCFERQLAEQIPMEAHDETVDAVITARGMMTAAA